MQQPGLQIVAFAGPAGAGKDTCADRFAARLAARIGSSRVRRMALAAPLRDACDALGVKPSATRQHKDRPCEQLGGATGRDLLVAVGRAIRDVGGPLYMARLLAARAREWAGVRLQAFVVVSDLRTVAEADELRAQAGAMIVWVDRPAEDRADGDRPAVDVWLDDKLRGVADREIANHADLDFLFAQIERLVAEVAR